jgi:REP element-mobilizing transposase RayT
MTPEFRSRRSVRLPDYDYGGFGAYFVTLCTCDRQGHFGQVTGDSVVLNEAGMLVTECWKAIPAHMPSVELDEFIVMPNHLRGIIWITGANSPATGRAPPWVAPTDESERPPGPIPGSLGAIIGAFKSVTAKRLGVFPELPSRIWQRNYYEEIIENDDSLNRIREYIIANPSRWSEDPYQQ